MSGMRPLGKRDLIVSAIVTLAGIATGMIGVASFVGGAAVAEQTGNSGKMYTGVLLILLGLFVAFTPPIRVICKALAPRAGQGQGLESIPYPAGARRAGRGRGGGPGRRRLRRARVLRAAGPVGPGTVRRYRRGSGQVHRAGEW